MRAYEFIVEAVKKPTRNTGLHPSISKITIDDVPKPFIDAFKERGITNPNTITAYYKVSGKETKAMGGPENIDYSTTPNKRIVKLFGEPNSFRGTNKSNPRNINYLPPDQVNWLKSDPERFGQFIYGGQKAKIVPDPKQGYRMEFDKPEDQQRAQDGYTYRGRGHVQITGRDQYAKVSQELFGDDRLVKNPDLVNDPSIGLRASAAYAKVFGKGDKDQSTDPTSSLNKALITVGGDPKKYSPGSRMYQSQIDGINTFAQNLADPNFKKQHDQHYASVQLDKQPASPVTQVAKTEPGMLDKLKAFGQQVGQNISNVLIKPAQAGATSPQPSFAPGAQGAPLPINEPQTTNNITTNTQSTPVQPKQPTDTSKNTAFEEDSELDEMAGEIHGGVRKVLMDKGYKYLGSGIDKQAYLEPKTGQVLLIFGYRKNVDDFSPDQRMFIDWINYCNKNKNNTHLPKFSGFESFQFQGKNYIQARMEHLVELPQTIRNVIYLLDEAAKYAGRGNFDRAWEKISDWAEQESFDNDDEPEWFDTEKVITLLGGLEQAKGLLRTVYLVKKFAKLHQFSLDLHSGNFMMRIDGTIVVNDPFVLWLN